MSYVAHLYCGLWGLPGCQIFSMNDAIRLVLGSFALACFIVWGFGLVLRRR